jgi:Protein of unknown function (DUF3617)
MSAQPQIFASKEMPMYRTGLCPLITLAALFAGAPAAYTQTIAPMKPGLWQMRVERMENGQKAPDPADRMQERMKSMPPEKRKQFEEMMKREGVSADDHGAMKVCYSKKMVESAGPADQGGCKTTFSNRSSTDWKWHSSCPALGYEGDGEATFYNSENFVVKSSGVSTAGGKSHTSTSTRTGKWLSADCGDLKAIEP